MLSDDQHAPVQPAILLRYLGLDLRRIRPEPLLAQIRGIHCEFANEQGEYPVRAAVGKIYVVLVCSLRRGMALDAEPSLVQ